MIGANAQFCFVAEENFGDKPLYDIHVFISFCI